VWSQVSPGVRQQSVRHTSALHPVRILPRRPRAVSITAAARDERPIAAAPRRNSVTAGMGGGAARRLVKVDRRSGVIRPRSVMTGPAARCCRARAKNLSPFVRRRRCRVQNVGDDWKETHTGETSVVVVLGARFSCIRNSISASQILSPVTPLPCQ